MGNYTPFQVYERVPYRQQIPDRVIFTGQYDPPSGLNAGVPVQLKILEPAAAAATWSTFTGAGYPDFQIAGAVRFDIPAWGKNICGTRIVYQVRGPSLFAPEDWETFTGFVSPRSDDHARTWVRKTDGDMHVLGGDEQPVKRWYPATLDELLWCIRHHHEVNGPVAEAHATASHWAMSRASVTHGQMIETATPVHEADGDQGAARLNNVLYDVIPKCLTEEAYDYFRRTQQVHVFDPNVAVDEEQIYLFHVESGMRIHELYAYADDDLDGKQRSLAARIEEEFRGSTIPPPNDFPCYLGPWALESMGGAGGQTIVGVASTATHGGDLKSSTVADLIVAMHLIAPDGQEYWIERTQVRPGKTLKLIDEAKLRDVYRVKDPDTPGGAQRQQDIVYLRDDNVMNAALVSCGRMGVIYSVVVRTVRQYGLRQDTREEKWADIKKWITNKSDPKYIDVFNQRFVRIDVDLYPQTDFDWGDAALMFATLALAGPIGLVAGTIFAMEGDEYRAWLLTRAKATLQQTEREDDDGNKYYYGRKERGGSNAGRNPPLEAEPDDGWFTAPCRSANFMRQFLTDIIGKLSDIRDAAAEAWIAAGAAMALFPPNAIWALPAQAVAAGVVVFTEYWILVMSGVRHILPDNARFGDFSCAVMNHLGHLQACSILQLVYELAQDSQHLDTDHALIATSYGVMDEHDYQNKGCVAPGDSIELFFDADKPDFVSFVDYVIDQVRDLADDGDVWAGYLSMRFMKNSPAFLGMQKWLRTVSMEIASLSRASGAAELMKRIEDESRKRNVILHWGQRNTRNQDEIEKAFPGSIDAWRDVLSKLSQHGRLANFSTPDTRLKGLEVTKPRVYGLSASLTEGCAEELIAIDYDAYNNPPGTALELVQLFDNDSAVTIELAEMRGTVSLQFGAGHSTVKLYATRKLNNHKYDATPMQLELQGFRTGDIKEFAFQAEQRMVAGALRWFVEINLFSQFISNLLRVSEVELSATTVADWVMRNAETGDVTFTGLNGTQILAAPAVFNTNWQFRSAAPAVGTVPPVLIIRFRILC